MHSPPSLTRTLLMALAVMAACSLSAQAGDAPTLAGSRRTHSYTEAVLQGRAAAEAVLARSGAESCLRGKLNRALLSLSSSCASLGDRTAICELANRAVVVTPMNLNFMDSTARRLLELSD